jgi:hypothetical protein
MIRSGTILNALPLTTVAIAAAFGSMFGEALVVTPSQFSGTNASFSSDPIGRAPPPYGYTNNVTDSGWIWDVGDYLRSISGHRQSLTDFASGASLRTPQIRRQEQQDGKFFPPTTAPHSGTNRTLIIPSPSAGASMITEQ